MCLSNLCEVEYEVSRGYITAYKVVTVQNETGDMCFKLNTGVNEAGPIPEEIKMNWGYSSESYKAGFHCFVSRRHARVYRDGYEKVIKVLVKPEDIVATGVQFFHNEYCPVIVAKNIKINSFKGL